jgi:tRNA(adenine34) deaminase
MRAALDAARAAGQRGEVPIGAVVVSPDGLALSAAGNACVGDSDALAHAEVRALTAASRALKTPRLDGATLYVTVEPCIMCLGACALHHVTRVIYAAPSPKFGAVSGGAVSCVDEAGREGGQGKVERESGTVATWPGPPYNHSLRIERGPLGEEAAALMRSFFEGKRREGAGVQEGAGVKGMK